MGSPVALGLDSAVADGPPVSQDLRAAPHPFSHQGALLSRLLAPTSPRIPALWGTFGGPICKQTLEVPL